MTEQELVDLIKNTYNKKAIYIPGLLVYYQKSKFDRKEIYFDKEQKETMWKTIHNSKMIVCNDENMQSFLSLRE